MDKIKNILTVALKAGEVSALIAVSLFLFQLRSTVQHADAVLDQVKATTVELQARADGTSQNLNAILIQAGLAADQARLASIEERQYLRAISKETFQVLASAKETVDTLSGTLKSTGQDLHSVSISLVATTGHLNDLLDQGNTTLRTANGVIGDPAVPQTLQNLQKASLETARATASLAGAASDIQKKVHDLTRPVSLVKQVFTSLLGWAASFAQILK
jgi:uncharacterized protein YoxC